MNANIDIFMALGFSAADAYRLIDHDLSRLCFVKFSKPLQKRS